MPHLDEGTIHSWLDGALPPDESAAVETHVAECATCAAAVAEARGLIAASSRILTALDDVPSNVVPTREGDDSSRVSSIVAAAAAKAAAGRAPRSWGRRYGRIAAVIAFIGVGVVVARSGRDEARAPSAATEVDSPTDVQAYAADAAPTAQAAPVPSSGATQSGAELKKAAPGGGIGSGAVGAIARQSDSAQARNVAPAERDESDRTEPSSLADARAPRPAATAPPPPAEPSARIIPPGAAGRIRGAQALSANQLAQISGRVTDSSGTPVSSAAVNVIGTTSSGVTGQDGTFNIPDVPAGTRTLEAQRAGYAVVREKVSTAPGDSLSVDLALGAPMLREEQASKRADADGIAEREVPGLALLNTAESLSDGRPVRRSLYQLRPGVTLTLVERRATARQSGAPVATSPEGMSQPRRPAAERRRMQTQSAARDAERPAQINTIWWTSSDGTDFTLSGAVPVEELEAVRRRIE